MNAQCQSSATHRSNLAAGLSVVDCRELGDGDGDGAVSLVRYSDGSTWIFDNAAAQRLSTVYGYTSANAYEEPAWFLSSARAAEFDQGCGGTFGAHEEKSADDVDLADILL